MNDGPSQTQHHRQRRDRPRDRPPDRLSVVRPAIAYDLARPRPELVTATETVAVDVLPTPAVTDSHYGVAFLGVHDGQNFCFVYVDWWANQNELIHRPFLAPLDKPTNLRPAETSEVGACVRDITHISHERQAWIETVMDNPNGPDVDAYLTRVFTGMH